MNKYFFEQINKEKEANVSKGEWQNWRPIPMQWFWETQEHLAKLQRAIRTNDIPKIREHSADLALYAEKAFTTYGKPNICLYCDGKGKGIFDVPYEAVCSHCNGTGFEHNEK